MPIRSRAALHALASPVRQEIMSALGDGPATVTDVAARLGRTRQSLYYQIAALVRADLVVAAAVRGQGRAREQVYALRRPGAAYAPAPDSPAELALASRATDAMLRLTAREFKRAVARLGDDASARSAGRRPTRALLAMRGKACLTRHDLSRLERLVQQIQALLARAKRRHPPPRPTSRDARPSACRLHAVTLMICPCASPGDRP